MNALPEPSVDFGIPILPSTNLAALNALARVAAAAWPGARLEPSTGSGLVLRVPRDAVLSDPIPVPEAADGRIPANDIEAEMDLVQVSADIALVASPDEVVNTLAGYALAILERLPAGLGSIVQEIASTDGNRFLLTVEPSEGGAGRPASWNPVIEQWEPRSDPEVETLRAEVRALRKKAEQKDAVLRRVSALPSIGSRLRSQARDAL